MTRNCFVPCGSFKFHFASEYSTSNDFFVLPSNVKFDLIFESFLSIHTEAYFYVSVVTNGLISFAAYYEYVMIMLNWLRIHASRQLTDTRQFCNSAQDISIFSAIFFFLISSSSCCCCCCRWPSGVEKQPKNKRTFPAALEMRHARQLGK